MTGSSDAVIDSRVQLREEGGYSRQDHRLSHWLPRMWRGALGESRFPGEQGGELCHAILAVPEPSQ